MYIIKAFKLEAILYIHSALSITSDMSPEFRFVNGSKMFFSYIFSYIQHTWAGLSVEEQELNNIIRYCRVKTRKR